MNTRYVSSVGVIDPNAPGPWKSCYCITAPCDCAPIYVPRSDKTRVPPQGAMNPSNWLANIFKGAGAAFEYGRDAISGEQQKQVEAAEDKARSVGRAQAGFGIAALALVAFFAYRKM